MKRIIELSIKGVGLALALFAVFGLVPDKFLPDMPMPLC